METKSNPRSRALGAAALAASVWLGACDGGIVPDAGTLDALTAAPAEDVQVVSLRRGQTLGEILGTVMDGNDQHRFLNAFRGHASPRRMREGTEITFRYLAGDRTLRRIDVALDGDRTVRLRRVLQGWLGETVTTPTYVDTVYASGRIENVLWNSVVGNPALRGLPRADRSRILDHLDRIFQWQVDFTRQIRQGDTWRFAFEREVRPDGTMRAGRILAAELVNSGTSLHAIWFDAHGDGRGSYYDLEGESVRRAFLTKPLEYRRISSRFNPRRFHPILKRWRAHRGVDYAADTGTPIMATSDGVVTHRGPKGGLGNAVIIRGPRGFVTRYGHLSRFHSDVRVGTRVKQGDIIGYVGMTGLAAGPHLHYEMLLNGRHVDPLSVDIPAGEPVPSEARDAWSAQRSARVALLETIPGGGPVRTQASLAEPPTSTAGGG